MNNMNLRRPNDCGCKMNYNFNKNGNDCGCNSNYRMECGNNKPDCGCKPECGNNKPDCGHNPEYGNNKPSCGCNPECGNNRPSCGCNQECGGNKPSCGCNPNCDADSSLYNDPLKGMALAIGYVPWQQWCKVYDLCKGLDRGTIFPPLDLPFYGCIPRGYFQGQGGAQ